MARNYYREKYFGWIVNEQRKNVFKKLVWFISIKTTSWKHISLNWHHGCLR
jgi:hypothetical protein